MHQTWCTWSVADQQCDMAISGKIPYGIDQRIGAGVVEALGNLYAIGYKLITQFQQLERLLCTGGAGAQHGIDRDALFSEVVADLFGMAFAVRGEPPLAVPASGAYILGLSMTKYEQDASLVHPSSLRRSP